MDSAARASKHNEALAKVIDTQFHLCYTFYITYETEVLTNDETTDVT